MRFLKIVVFTLLFVLITPVLTLADTTLGITPLKLDYELKPGESVTKTIQAFNPGQDALRVTATVSDYRFNAKGVPVFQPPGANPESAGNWLSVTPQEFMLAPGETKQITLHVKAPQNTGPGGHYGAVLFEFGGEKNQKTGVGVSGRIAVVNLITVPGQIKKSGVLQDFYIPFMSSGYPVPIQLTVNNTGNLHLPLDGNIVIKNWWGTTVATVPIPEGYVYPGSSKTINLEMPSGSLFGFYRAEVSFVDPAFSGPSQPKVFIVFPWPLVMGIVLAAFGLYKLGVTRGGKKEN